LGEICQFFPFSLCVGKNILPLLEINKITIWKEREIAPGQETVEKNAAF